MPEVDFMILCDYVRSENGVLHMIAAGIDRIRAASVPSGQNVGIAMRLALTRAECERKHDIELIFQDEDGARLLAFRGEFGATYPDNVPPGWPAYGALPINLGLPLPKYGVYSLELLIDGQSKKSIPVLVERLPQTAIGGGDAAQDD